ncbi:hypothetical protein [Conexibacter sp. SYSU D00693]|uniref:hypothetical protein n=1 Tax=Conexibacter sp. SYSU D00693 TaxID=2812560 RepID=UPI00196B7140|nr:hypothetical protein [Conexibacter sp. SYSU D00693]
MTDEDDPLDQLRERVRATQAAAEKLIAEGVPPQGWATPEDHAEATREVQALAALLQALRDLVPPDLQEQLREVIRQLLLLVRALVDWWVQRIEDHAGPGPAPGDAGPRLEDIPVDGPA